MMLVLAALSLFLFSTAFMALPILVGRAFFDSTSSIMLRFGLKHDDLCTFWFGWYILEAIYITTCFVSDHIHKGRTDLLIKNISTWIRNALLFSIWVRKTIHFHPKKKLLKNLGLLTCKIRRRDLCHTGIARSTHRPYDHHPLTCGTR